MAVFSEESMKSIREAPDRWWNELTYIEKSSIKSTIDLMGRVASGDLAKKWGKYDPEVFKNLKGKIDNGS